MIIVILVLTLVLIVAGILLLAMDHDFGGTGCSVIGAVGFIIALFVLIGLCVSVSELKVIDDKIAMYQEENTKIEAQISEAVKQYQQYENDIFTEVAPDSAMTLVALYPELKADALVQKQIEVYINNNEEIKELKENKINGSVYRWWLYFGG